MCGFADEPGVEPVNRGLVHCVQNLGQVVLKFPLRHDACGMSRPILASNFCRDWSLVLRPTSELFEGQGHGLDILLSGVTHETDQRSGVDSARKECANWDIRHEMMTHAVKECFPDAVLLIVIAGGRAYGLRAAVRIRNGKILLCLASADTINPERRTRRQSPDFLKGRKRLGNAAKQTEADPTSGLWISGNLLASQQRFNLGRKTEGPPIVRIVQRLNAVWIPRK